MVNYIYHTYQRNKEMLQEDCLLYIKSKLRKDNLSVLCSFFFGSVVVNHTRNNRFLFQNSLALPNDYEILNTCVSVYLSPMAVLKLKLNYFSKTHDLKSLLLNIDKRQSLMRD